MSSKKEILEELRQKILTEYYPQGHSLIERDLCENYGISRTPMREVLWSLVVDGLVTQKPAYGFFVRKLDGEQIFEIYQAREAVEGMAARIAGKQINIQQTEKFKALREELLNVNVEADSTEEAVNLGRRMHKLIIDTANNSLISEIYIKLGYLAALTSNMAKTSPLTEAESKKHHIKIIQAIIDQDPDLSEKYMREHLRATCKNLIKLLYPKIYMGINF
ncbi:MAG: GntR family transcriptional regulator [Spirochaetia bacterium]|nr:GntR family transcriptional regulator [Spirochaetia bacterium]MCF7945305.1 GntR family transcriptional regulator [Spirochaetia bacterium]MCF7946588.1 GntR family transcriptional regulator [Spirochaetia bacterium]